jgi:hypothetical protein
MKTRTYVFLGASAIVLLSAGTLLSWRSPAVRDCAVRKCIGSQKTLADMALNDPDPTVRKSAVSKLVSQAALEHLALKGADLPLRMSACAKVYDDGLLFTLARQSQDHAVRLSAATRLDDADRLAELVLATDEDEVRSAAMERIHANAALLRIALDAADPALRLLATGRIGDQATLSSLLAKSADDAVRRAAFALVTGNDRIDAAATSDRDAVVRKMAMMKVKDTLLLVRAALEDPDAEVRTVAAGRVTDREAVRKYFGKGDAAQRSRVECALAILTTCFNLPEEHRARLTPAVWEAMHYLRLPEVAAELGPVETLKASWRSTSAIYDQEKKMNGEVFTLTLVLGNLKDVMRHEWTTPFPKGVFAKVTVEDFGFSPCLPKPVELLKTLFTALPDEARVRLLTSNDETVRLAASSTLMDRAALQRTEATDASEQVRKAATDRMRELDQAEAAKQAEKE